jgi:hypothetical protein
MEGSMQSFMNKSKLVQSFQHQYSNSDDYIILNTDRYPVDNIDVMLKYQNMYKDNFPNASLKDSEVLTYLKASSSQQSKGFLELLSKMSNQ